MKKYLIILMSGIVIGLLTASTFRCEGKRDPEIITKTKVVTKTTIDTVEVHTVDTVYNDIPVYITNNTPTSVTPISEDEIETSFQISENYFKGLVIAKAPCKVNTVNLKGQFLQPTITKTDSITIYQTDSVFVTNTIKNKKHHNLYLTTGANFDKSSWLGQSFGVYYGNHKLILGGGVDYHFDSNDFTYNAKMGLRLFNRK